MALLRRVIRIIYWVIAGLITLVIVAANVRLYHAGDPGLPGGLAESRAHLAFIRASLDSGGGESMQSLFPEGYFFSHIQYGLTWIALAEAHPDDAELHAQAIREARVALAAIRSEKGSAPFPADLDPPYGVFYNGWTAWLEGSILHLETPAERDNAEVEAFTARCDALADAFERGQTPFLMAYRGQAWPVDSVVAMAALSLHDQAFPPAYTEIIARWEVEARARLDVETGLLPHQADPESGASLDGARGSSQSMINRFLPIIDPMWAADQYLRFRKQFVVVPLGVREYPAGVDRPGDVDSGPLIMGISASASVVSIGAARANRDPALGDALSGGAEMVGLPLEWGGQKFYGLGLLPVGDTMLAWSRAARPPAGDLPSPPPDIVPGTWRLPMHGISILLLILLWFPGWFSLFRALRQRGALSERVS